MCICGARDPEFNGYCGDCVKKLSDKFTSELWGLSTTFGFEVQWAGFALMSAEERKDLVKCFIEEFGQSPEEAEESVSYPENCDFDMKLGEIEIWSPSDFSSTTGKPHEYLLM